MKNDDQHCTLIAMFWSKQLFCLDPQWSTSTASCSTRSSCTGPCTPPSRTRSGTRRGWMERTLFLDPIIYDVWGPGVLSWTPCQPCNSHHARHKTHRHQLFSVCVVVLSFITSRSVAAATASSARSGSFYHGFLARSVAATRRIFVGVSVHHSFWMCLVPAGHPKLPLRLSRRHHPWQLTTAQLHCAYLSLLPNRAAWT